MAARFEPLGDDCIDLARLEPARFLDGGRIADHDRAARLDPIEQFRLRQAEVEARHLGPQLLDDGAHFGIEREAKRTAVARRDAEFVIIRPQDRSPRAVVGVIRHAMAEEVEVERTLRLLPDLADLGADLVGREQRAGQRAERSAGHRRNAQRDSAGTGHRRLDDRMIGAGQIEPAAVGPAYHSPLFGIDDHGSAGARAAPFCSSSTEMLSGVRTKAIRPSRGGRLIVTPESIRRWQVW